MRAVLSVSVLCLLAVGTAGAQVAGRATALGSDTLELNGVIFQLHGVDGIEFHQPCYVDGQPWACGAPATRAMQTLLDNLAVTCAPTGGREGDTVPAVCTGDGDDIAETMVRNGWAFADPSQSRDYVAAEQEARDAGAGVWRGTLVEPWMFRDDMAAIETRYSQQVVSQIRDETAKVLGDERGGIDVFKGFDVVHHADGGPNVKRSFRVPELLPGFIPGAIRPPDVFSWRSLSQILETWQGSTSTAAVGGIVGNVWSGLAERPARYVNIVDAEELHDAMVAGARRWIEAGRQPILLIRTPAVPGWINTLLSGDAPRRVDVTVKEDIDAPNYVATVNGIDVYTGAAPALEYLMFPDDLLVRVTYGDVEGDDMVTIRRDQRLESSELEVSYAMGIEWRDDDVVHLVFEPFDAESPYGSY